MKTTFFNPYVSGHAIKAICWTFIHSLWIGIIAAALAGLVIATTRKATANLRYRLLCGIMMLFVAATTFTFFAELDRPVHTNTLITLSSNATGQTVINTVNADVTIDGFNYTRAVYFLDQYSAWIFAAWLLCFAFKSVKLTRELLYVRRVRSVNVFDIGDEWQNKVSAFAGKLGIMQFIGIKESGLINIPVTVGYLKPIILLPAGMIMQLSPGQIESVIYHELAHILRRDYLVNILQSVVETVFFFNPAIWWISTLIREERETCCDDIVLAHVQQKRNYLEALMAFEGYQSNNGGYVMTLSLRKNQLMNRLRRMVNNENQKLNAAEKMVLLAGMVLLSMFLFVPKAQSEVKHGANLIKKQMMAMVSHIVKHSTPTPPPIKKASLPKGMRLKKDTLKTTGAIEQLTDTLPKLVRMQFNKNNADSLNHEVTVTDDINNSYYLKTVNGKLIGFAINGVEIPEAEYSHYQSLINRVNQMITRTRTDKEKRVKDKVQLLNEEHDIEMARIGVKKQRQEARDAEMHERNKERNERDNIRSAKNNERDNKRSDKAHGKRERVLTDEQGNTIEMRNEKDASTMILWSGKTGDTLKLAKWKIPKGTPFTKPRWDINDAKSLSGDGMPKGAPFTKPRWDINDAKSRSGDSMPKGAPFTKPRWDINYGKPRSRDSVRAKKKHQVDISNEQDRVRGVIAALVDEKVVSNAAGVDWFGLSDDELIVNGNKQPEALHQRLKAQYGIKPNNGLYYGPVKMTGTGVFLDKKDL